MGYKYKPFILASQAIQVFYANDSANIKWFIVLLTNKISDNKKDEEYIDHVDVKDDHFFSNIAIT